MKKTAFSLLISLLICASGQQVCAQYNFSDDLYYDHPITYEMGASIGIMNCFTDLGGKKDIGQKYFKDIRIGNSQVAGSIFFKANYRYFLGLRAEATFGQVKAADEGKVNEVTTTYGRDERNLSFKSNIVELMLALEVHPRFFKTFEKGTDLPRISPYLMGGIGFFSFNPRAKLNGDWIDLHPLSTEGQGFSEYPDRKSYKLRQFNFPVGIGVQYKATPLCNVSFECVSRILMTDYLDDVSTEYIDPIVFANHLSGQDLTNALLLNDRQQELNPSHTTNAGWQRGNPNNKDSYFTFNLKISLIF
jgi:hypothetical protein